MSATSRWWRRSDHYYWLTSLLAARAAQASTCRRIALATFTFGLIPMAMLASPSGPKGGRGVALAATVTTVTTVQAAMWLRRSWPSKNRSGAYVVIAALCIAVFCLILSQPVAGMLSCTVFAALAGYIAFFHSPRFMVFNVVVALATMTVVGIRIAAQGDPVLAVCGSLAVAVVIVAIPLFCDSLIQMLDVDVSIKDMDPLTGLMNRDAFYRHTAELFSVRGRVDDRYLMLVLVDLDNFGLLIDTGGQAAGDRARVAVAQTLRETTRGDVVVAHSGTAEFLIADTFAAADATPLVERVRGAIATTPPRLTASIGVLCTPLRALAELPPQGVLDALIAMAHAEMTDARRAGGNQARYRESAAPRLDDCNIDPDDDVW